MTQQITASTERLTTALHDAYEVEKAVRDILDKYNRRWDVRSICALSREFPGATVEVNGDPFIVSGRLMCDSAHFSWDGNPDKVEMLRIGSHRSLYYVYLNTAPADGAPLIDMFDVGIEEDGDEWAESVTVAKLEEELASRGAVPEQVKQEAIRLFVELRDMLVSHGFSLCYDEDNADLFIGPKGIAWNAEAKPGERLYVTPELVQKYADEGHIANDCIVHLHIGDNCRTFKDGNLTYSL
jgi:hypothetical protein